MKKLIIAGGTGFLGNALIAHFKSTYNSIVVLTRGKARKEENISYVHWDAESIGPWAKEINGSEVLINMAGRSVDCRYTEKNKALIFNSRVKTTKLLSKVVQEANKPPKVWLNSSTATIYRHSLDKEMDEQNGELGSGFSVAVAKAWEAAFFSSNTPKTRKVTLRTSIVLSDQGGAFLPLKNLAKFGFGGKQGPGNQKFSWIHIDDFIHSLEFIIKTETLKGAINIVAPKPTTNEGLMRLLRAKLGVPFGIALSKSMLEIGAVLMRTETELVLKSRNVIPKTLLEAGFKFNYTTIADALQSLTSKTHSV